jgi:TRAP-type C4-dicarboxylate transport system permease small subunit
MNLLPYAIAWGVLAIVVIVLAIMRRQIAEKEDDTLHLSTAEESLVQEQKMIAAKLDKIDKWGKSLTVVLVITGVALAGLYGWQIWEASSTAGLR